MQSFIPKQREPSRCFSSERLALAGQDPKETGLAEETLACSLGQKRYCSLLRREEQRQGKHQDWRETFYTNPGQTSLGFHAPVGTLCFPLPHAVTHVRIVKQTSHAGHSAASSRPVKAIPSEKSAFGSIPRSCQ